MSEHWNTSFETGHDHIDTHHKDLFELIHRLDRAVHSHNPEELESVIVFLETHVTEHFSDEEALMHVHHYPELKRHMTEHDKMRKRMQELRAHYDTHAFTAHLVFDLRRFIDQMVRHIQTIDSGISHLEADHEPS